MRVHYNDLLGRMDINCGEVAREVLIRMGLRKAAEHIPTDQDSGATLVRLFHEGKAPWKEVAKNAGDAKDGDIVLQRSESNGLHVYAANGGRGITFIQSYGVIAPPLSRIQNCLGVYRYSG